MFDEGALWTAVWTVVRGMQRGVAGTGIALVTRPGEGSWQDRETARLTRVP